MNNSQMEIDPPPEDLRDVIGPPQDDLRDVLSHRRPPPEPEQKKPSNNINLKWDMKDGQLSLRGKSKDWVARNSAGLRDDLWAEAIAKWELMEAETPTHDREQWLRNFDLHNDEYPREGYGRTLFQPVNRYGDRVNTSYLGTLGFNHRNQNSQAILHQQFCELLRDRKPVYLGARRDRQPLADINKNLKGGMFTHPVYSTVLLDQLTEVLKSQENIINVEKIRKSGPSPQHNLASSALKTLQRLWSEHMPTKEAWPEMMKDTVVLRLGTDRETDPHVLMKWDEDAQQYLEIKESTQYMDEFLNESRCSDYLSGKADDDHLDHWVAGFCRLILLAAQEEADRLDDWEKGFSQIVGLDGESFHNVDGATCEKCENSDDNCFKNDMERLHFTVGRKFFTILLPSNKAKTVNQRRFGKYLVPKTGRTEGVFSCTLTNYTTRPLAAIMKLLGKDGPFTISVFDMDCERRSIDFFLEANKIREELDMTSSEGSYDMRFVESDMYKNPLAELIKLPENPARNFKRGCNAQQLYTTGTTTPTGLWRQCRSQSFGDYYDLDLDRSPAELVFLFLYHRNDTTYPRLSIYILLIISLFNNMSNAEINDATDQEMMFWIFLEKLVRDSTGEGAWKLSGCEMPQYYYHMVDMWRNDGIIPPSVLTAFPKKSDLLDLFRIKDMTKIDLTFTPVTDPGADGRTTRDSGRSDSSHQDATAASDEAIEVALFENLDELAAANSQHPTEVPSAIDDTPQEGDVEDLDLALDAPVEQVLEFLNTLTQDGQMTVADTKATARYLERRVKLEVYELEKPVKDKIRMDVNYEVGECDRRITGAQKREKLLGPRIKDAVRRIQEAEIDIRRYRSELKEESKIRETESKRRSLAKSRGKKALSEQVETIKSSVISGLKPLKAFIDARGQGAVSVDMEMTISPPREHITRRFSVQENRPVILPDYAKPTFLTDEQFEEFKSTLKYKFLVWTETLRIAKILNDPTVVEMFNAIKGGPCMGGAFGYWSRATTTQTKKLTSWRDNKCAHLAFHRLIKARVTSQPTMPEEAVNEGMKRLRHVEHTLKLVSLKLFSVPTEEPYTWQGLLEPKYNPSVTSLACGVSVAEYDGETARWLKGCKFGPEPDNSPVAMQVEAVVPEQPPTAPPAVPPREPGGMVPPAVPVPATPEPDVVMDAQDDNNAVDVIDIDDDVLSMGGRSVVEELDKEATIQLEEEERISRDLFQRGRQMRTSSPIPGSRSANAVASRSRRRRERSDSPYPGRLSFPKSSFSRHDPASRHLKSRGVNDQREARKR